MTLTRRGRTLAAAVLLTTLFLAGCGATPEPPAATPATHATFDGATFDTSTWR